MNKKEFYEGLGLISPVIVPEDKLKLVAPKKKQKQHNPSATTDSTKQEIDSLKSKVDLLTKKHQHNDEVLPL